MVLAQIQRNPTTGPFVRMVKHNDGSRTVTASPDSTKKTQEITTYDAQGTLRLKRVYRMNQYDKPDSFIISDGAGRPLVEGKFNYDMHHRLQTEELFELPSRQLLRRQVHSYDLANQDSVRTTNYAALPPELLRWMDPDGYVAGIKTPQKGVNGPIWHRGNSRQGRSGATTASTDSSPRRTEQKKGVLGRMKGWIGFGKRKK